MMQRIALIGASGRIGSAIAGELVRRGYAVTGIVRHPDRVTTPGVTAVVGDVTDSAGLASVLRGHDAIISSASFVPGHAEHLIAGVRASGVRRFLMVGGAASLEVEPGKRVIDTIELPDAWRAPVLEGIRTLALLRQVEDVDWTFFSPAIQIGPGERTGVFRLGTEQVVKDAEGASRISFDDYAIAMVDELEHGRHRKARFTIGY